MADNLNIPVTGKAVDLTVLDGKLVRSDHNATRVTFTVQKVVDGIDLSGCNFCVKGVNEDEEEVIDALEKTVPSDSNTFTVVWNIEKNFTAVNGIIKLWLVATKTENGEVALNWNSDPVQVSVKDGVFDGDYETAIEKIVLDLVGYVNTAKTYSVNSANSATESASSAEAAKTSANQASANAAASLLNASNAAASASAAKTSENNAASSKSAAASSASAAKTSENNAKTSETNSKTSENNAATSKANAASSASAAATSASAAASSATSAKNSASNASSYSSTASSKAASATASANNAATSETNAGKSATAAAASAKTASDAADRASAIAGGNAYLERLDTIPTEYIDSAFEG